MSASTSTPHLRRSPDPLRFRRVRTLTARHGSAVGDRSDSPARVERSSSGVSIPPASAARRSFAARLVLGGVDDPRWARPLLWALLVGTAVLYLVDLTNSGYANSFYAAAVKSGTESVKAWLFGSLDAGNSITVDKPPASLWLMVLSARIFGFSSFSLLLPQALLGVGTVALTYATVRRWSGQAAGLIAGAVLALTPVAALMFRYDNPDALLVFLMTLAAYAVVRAVDAGRPQAAGITSRTGSAVALRWMLIAGAALGFAFLTKMMQGLLVLPALGAVYLVASPLRLRTRIVHLLAAAGSLIVAAGWFIALVAVCPAASRPYIGGSTDNSLWELAIGYNGLQRLLSGGGGGGMGGGNTGFGGTAGLFRMFNTAFGTQISWLLPAALIGLVAGLILVRRTPRTNLTRAGLLLWGGWLAVTTLVFSFMSGTTHPYYAVALAPAIGAVVGIAATRLWARRDDHLARGALAAMIFATGVWGCYLMGRDADGWSSWLRWVMLAGAVIGSGLLVVSTGALQTFAVAAVLVGSLASIGGTAAYTVATVSTGHTGSIPTAGPAVAGSGFGFGGGGTGGMGGPVGSSDTTSSTSALISMLNDTSTRWSAAVVGDQSAAGYILSSDTAVLAIGGWSGSDPSPTLAQFQEYVATGQITYFITGGDGRGGGGRGGSDSVGTQITAWVTANYTSTTVDGVTVYDLTTN